MVCGKGRSGTDGRRGRMPTAVGSHHGYYQEVSFRGGTMMDTKKMDLADTQSDGLPATLQVFTQRERQKRGLSLRASAGLIGIGHTEL